MLNLIRGKMLSKKLGKEMGAVLQNRASMFAGNKEAEAKYVRKFATEHNLPIIFDDEYSIDEFVSVLDLIIEDKLQGKMGEEIANYMVYDSFKNSYLMDELKLSLEGNVVVVTESDAVRKLVKSIDRSITVISLDQICSMEYYNVTLLIDNYSINKSMFAIDGRHTFRNMSEVISKLNKNFHNVEVLNVKSIMSYSVDIVARKRNAQ